ncbi:MAG: glycosyltransferase, partial [Moorea sp. SIO3E2]|nr:glycosyltransferase [Moorena sp. SIO3E2]
MRILIYSYNYHPEPIGIAPLMTELAEGLVKRGHDVRVITAMPNYPQRQIYEGYRGKLYLTEHIKGVIVDRCYVRIRPKPNLIDRLLLEASFVATSFLKALSSPRPDIIILTSPPLLVSLPAVILGWIHRTPVILNLQDILPEAAIKVGLLSNQPLIRALEVVERFAYRTVTKISVIADGFTDNLRSKGVPSSKIVKITNWVDVNFIRPLPKENNSFRTAH